MPIISIPLLFPILSNPDDFEDLCVDLLRIHWNRPQLERFGVRGERQFGIDILDTGGIAPLHAAQCKLREYGKKLSPKEISDEILEALKFVPSLGKYGILTTAKVSTQAQTRILEINQRHREQGLFEVELFTWNKICRLLQGYDSVREIYYGAIAITSTSRFGQNAVEFSEQKIEILIADSVQSITNEIDAAREAIRNRENQLALLLLNRILQRNDSKTITRNQHFRIISNLGFAEAGLGRSEQAAKYFLDALELEPQDDRAKINEVLAYVLMGDLVTAHTKADVLRSRCPDDAKLASYWVTSAPRTIALESLEHSLSQGVKADADVSLALARRALMELDLATGLSYAESAARLYPAAPQPQLVIAQANMGRLVRAERGRSNPPSLRIEIERRTENALMEAIRLAELGHDERTRVDALVIRSELRLMQKRPIEAANDARSAHRINPDNIQAILALSQIYLNASQMDEAISLLERAHRIDQRPDVEFMYARALLRRGQAEDFERAASALISIDIESLLPEMRPQIVFFAVQAILRKQEPALAHSYLEQISGLIDAVVLDSLNGYIADNEGRKEEALQFAHDALKKVVPTTLPEAREFVARLFMSLDYPSEALPLFQDLFASEGLSFDWHQLLNCAAQLHRDDVVISVCAELRNWGVDEWAVVGFEVQHLQKYSRDKAILRLNQFLQDHPDHKIATLMRSIIGVQAQRPELVRGKLEDLPLVEKLVPDHILAAIHVLRFSEAGNATVDYAYRYLRLHFDDIRAHEAMILSLMPGDASVTITATSERVEVGSAVCVQQELDGALRWFVLEQTDRPSSEFEELPLASELASELLGKQIGDAVTLARGHMENRVGTVRQIMPKYVRRFQDCMGEMQVRFGSASTVEAVHMGASEAEITKNLEKVLESARKRGEAIVRVRAVYDQLPISLHLFGEQFGKNAYLALVGLANESGQTVKCSTAIPAEREQGIFALQTCSTLIIDLTAICTIRMIGLEKLLKTKRFHLQMSEDTWNELQDTLVGDLFSGTTGGTLAHHDGVTRFIEETADDKAKRRLADEEFLDMLKNTVEVKPVMELASLDPEKRNQLVQLVGQYGAESIILASSTGSALWTDDLILAQLAAKEFDVKRAWTQLVIEQIALVGEITGTEWGRAVASLIGFEYATTNFDSTTLLNAVEMADATPWRSPLKQFVDIFQRPNGNLQALLNIFVDFTVKLYRESYLPESRRKIIAAFLDALWRNVSLRIPLLRIRRGAAQLFILNPVGQAQFEECFDSWYQTVADRIVAPVSPQSRSTPI